MQQALTLRLECEGTKLTQSGEETRVKNAIARQVTNES